MDLVKTKYPIVPTIKRLYALTTIDPGHSITVENSVPIVVRYMNSKPVLNKRPLKKKTKLVFTTDYRLMQVKNIAECSKRAFCNIFDLHLATIGLSIFDWPLKYQSVHQLILYSKNQKRVLLQTVKF